MRLFLVLFRKGFVGQAPRPARCPLAPLWLLLLTAGLCAADPAPVAAVTRGKIRGAALEKGGAVFKGIPFAQPPAGDLRWREPAPLQPWSGVRDTTVYGPACAQNSG